MSCCTQTRHSHSRGIPSTGTCRRGDASMRGEILPHSKPTPSPDPSRAPRPRMRISGLCLPVQTCFAATSVVHYWGAAPNPAATACYQHFLARTASASACSRQLVLLRRTRIQSVPPSLLPRAVVSPSKQSVAGGTAPPRQGTKKG
jgi:hypothetical protein